MDSNFVFLPYWVDKILKLNNRQRSVYKIYVLYLFSSSILPISSRFSNIYLISESHSVLSDSSRLHGLYSPWNSLGQDTGVGNRSLLQGTFPTQGSNPRSPALQADSLQAEPHEKLYLYLSVKSAWVWEIRMEWARRIRSDQIRSVTQLCSTLCDPVPWGRRSRTTPRLPRHREMRAFVSCMA